MYKDILGFSITPFMQRIMNINGFYASIMRTGKKTEGESEDLPPGIPIPVLPVDYLKSRPDNWIGGEGSYICPVNSEWGLWFNWSMNNPSNTAILASVKGMNPLTGQRVAGYELEEYQEECPVHHKPFSKGKLCPDCGFKWPHQNYISQPNKFYTDGFVTPSGVRQFYFTEDMAKSIPELVIGKDDVVPAFGFCFYKLKSYDPTWESGNHIKNEFPKDSRHQSFWPGGVTGITGSTGSCGLSGDTGILCVKGAVMPGCYCSTLNSAINLENTSYGHGRGGSAITNYSDEPIRGTGYGDSVPCAANFYQPEFDSATLSTPKETNIDYMETSEGITKSADAMKQPIRHRRDFSSSKKISMKLESRGEVGVGAGAKIRQSFEKSKKSVEDWEKKPAGVIRLYFVFQEQFEKYVEAGFNNLKGNELGYLAELPVGGKQNG